jgi:putative oxidoreductase
MRGLRRTLVSSATARLWGIGLLRLVIGTTFLFHGWQKVVELGIPAVQQGFDQMGVPGATTIAPLVAYLELLGGAVLIVGLFTRWVSLALAIDMLAAMALVHWNGGFFAPQGVELPLALFTGLLTLFLGGPGAIALDHLLAEPTLLDDLEPLEMTRPQPRDWKRPAA